MKHLTILFLLCWTKFSYAQNQFCYQNFHFDQGQPTNLFIDTVSNPNNIWQIGIHNKANFYYNISLPNVIITDTVQPYPVNDTSSFIITAQSCGGFQQNIIGGVGFAEIKGYYQVLTDSLNDYGLIEISFDQGANWLNLLEDSLRNNYVFSVPQDFTLTGNSGGWGYFELNFERLGELYSVDFDDTVLYRFTFISDGNPEALPGIMFDDVIFNDHITGIDELDGHLKHFTIFPNPTSDRIVIRNESEARFIAAVDVVDACGRTVLSENLSQLRTSTELSLHFLQSGSYYIRVTDADGNIETQLIYKQ